MPRATAASCVLPIRHLLVLRRALFTAFRSSPCFSAKAVTDRPLSMSHCRACSAVRSAVVRRLAFIPFPLCISKRNGGEVNCTCQEGNCVSVGIRLKEERKRLGLTQEAMGLACGVAKRTQILFEQDAHLPGGAYFVAADELGLDVTYVLVGRRDRLAEADADLLDAWRSASASARAAVMAALRGVTAATPTATPRTSFENTSIAQQISGDVDLRGQKVVVRAPKASKKPSR